MDTIQDYIGLTLMLLVCALAGAFLAGAAFDAFVNQDDDDYLEDYGRLNLDDEDDA